jgi:hypothetical protein
VETRDRQTDSQHPTQLPSEQKGRRAQQQTKVDDPRWKHLDRLSFLGQLNVEAEVKTKGETQDETQDWLEDSGDSEKSNGAGNIYQNVERARSEFLAQNRELATTSGTTAWYSRRKALTAETAEVEKCVA